MNQEAVVLGADSAVSSRYFHATGFHKFFTLSQSPPIAVMIYNAVHYSGVGWSIIFDEFSKLYEGQIVSVDKAADFLLDYIKDINKNKRYSIDEKVEFSAFEEYIVYFVQHVFGVAQKIGWDTGRLPLSVVIDHAMDVCRREMITESHLDADKTPEASGLNTEAPDEFLAFFEKNIEAALQSGLSYICYKYDVSRTAVELPVEALQGLAKLALLSCLTDWVPEDYGEYCAGLVIAGFDTQTPFPMARDLKVYPCFGGLTKVTEAGRHVIGVELAKSSVVRTYAQMKIVKDFLYVIDPRTRKRLTEELRCYVNMMRRGMVSLSNKIDLDTASEINVLFDRFSRDIPTVIDSALPHWLGNVKNYSANVRNSNPTALKDLALKTMIMVIHEAELGVNDSVGRPLHFLTLTKDKIVSDTWE